MSNLNNWLILILSPLSFLIVLSVLIIRPLFIIRFGEILIYRFGHTLKNVEIYSANKKLEKSTGFFSKKIDIFFFSAKASNEFLKTICKRHFLVMPFQLIYSVFVILNWLSILSNFILIKNYDFNQRTARDRDKTNYNFFDKHIIFIRNYDYDQNNLLDKTKSILNFTKEEIEKGDSLLERLGIRKGEKFVCFVTRDNTYLKEYLNDPNQVTSVWTLRNSDVETYKLAAEELVRLGYKVIRAGKYTEKKITFGNSNIIDYANSNYASDFLDIYLAYKCEFAFGDSSGWSTAPMAFRKHFAFANWAPYDTVHFYSKKNTFIFKKYFSRDLQKILSLNEMEESNIIAIVGRTADLEKKNIQLIDNTPEEIKDLVIEVEKKYRGEFIIDDENLYLQNKFRDFIKKNVFSITRRKYTYKLQSYCGTKFLKTIKFN